MRLRFHLLFGLVLALCSCGEDGGGSTPDGLVTGTGGSTARMTIAGNYLYAISGRSVQLFDISAPESPNPWVKVDVDWNIQTLFPYGDYLLVGAADGVHILDNTDPASPVYLSDFRHATSRDPVVAKDNYAYVTLASDDTVPGGLVDNQMNVLDINDLTTPELVKTLPMQEPKGLAIDGNKLFVCDGPAGLKIFDIDQPLALSVISSLPEVDCNDVIAKNNLLYIITDSRLLQYDYSVLPPELISDIYAGS